MQFKVWFQSEVEFGSTRRTDSTVLDCIAFPHSPTLPPTTNHAVLGLSAYFDIERIRVLRSHRVIRRQWCHVAAFLMATAQRCSDPMSIPASDGSVRACKDTHGWVSQFSKTSKASVSFYLPHIPLLKRYRTSRRERERERKEICLLHKVECVCVRARSPEGQYSNTVSITTYTTYPLLNSPAH